MADKTIICKDCKEAFVFTEGEQAFYKEKGFTSEPVRCAKCRKARKMQRPQRYWNKEYELLWFIFFNCNKLEKTVKDIRGRYDKILKKSF